MSLVELVTSISDDDTDVVVVVLVVLVVVGAALVEVVVVVDVVVVVVDGLLRIISVTHQKLLLMHIFSVYCKLEISSGCRVCYLLSLAELCTVHVLTIY